MWEPLCLVIKLSLVAFPIIGLGLNCIAESVELRRFLQQLSEGIGLGLRHVEGIMRSSHLLVLVFSSSSVAFHNLIVSESGSAESLELIEFSYHLIELVFFEELEGHKCLPFGLEINRSLPALHSLFGSLSSRAESLEFHSLSHVLSVSIHVKGLSDSLLE
jgi:hypothetical protein